LADFYVPEAELEDRARFLEEVAIDLVTSGVLPDERIVQRRRRIPLVTNGYFLLNQAYKAWRISENHNTERPKIASLLCLAIETFVPFR
jgi:hypothetical protein